MPNPPALPNFEHRHDRQIDQGELLRGPLNASRVSR
jgi:hypothetical protein